MPSDECAQQLAKRAARQGDCSSPPEVEYRAGRSRGTPGSQVSSLPRYVHPCLRPARPANLAHPESGWGANTPNVSGFQWRLLKLKIAPKQMTLLAVSFPHRPPAFKVY
ncbi:hypothetical protein ACOMHN_008092 [Nucella lapillus]